MPGTPPSPTPGPAANDRSLPAQPPADQVRMSFQSMRRRIRDCARGSLGGAQATVTVDGPTGRVVDARVSYHNPSAASCMAQALRGAYFPRARSRYVANHSYRIGIFR
jgi:hypothetical protein